MTTAPKRIALLIGCATDALTVDLDLHRMSVCLHQHGFRVEPLCQGPAATREGVLGRLDTLLATADEGCAYVIYYTGHARLCQFEGELLAGVAGERLWPYLVTVPTRDDGSFEGILSEELSERVRALAEVTVNVTTVLDCCHAEVMVRRPPDTFPAPVNLERLVETLKRLRDERTLATEHPNVVQLASSPRAARSAQSTREGSLFTQLLTDRLNQPRADRRPWARHLAAIHEHMGGRSPVLHGPRGRLPFSTESVEIVGDVAYAGDVWLRGGSLQGLELKTLVEFRGQDEDEPPVVARVDRVEGLRARVVFETEARPQLGAFALVKSVATKLGVDLRGRSPLAERARDRLRTACRVELSTQSPLVLSIDDVITLEHGGIPIRHPRQLGALDAALADVEALARAEAFVAALAPEHEGLIPDAPYAFDWAIELLLGDERRVLSPNDVIHHGDRFCVRFTNRSRGNSSLLHFSLLDHGVAGKLGLVTTYSRGGLSVAPRTSAYFFTGEPLARKPKRFEWPSEVPEDHSGECELIVVVSTGPTDLTPMTARQLGDQLDSLRGPRVDMRVEWGFARLPLRLAPSTRPPAGV
ncbi:caspase family protein [Pseudenhygromyxa sp. WMMC2535]|uniref:caspase family protein n=1 Tax=Pseudenhygromyxa sp. WMMC2535 TaxID=2712867 RepID=UPI00155829B2|nr:caspase family protein [Pseudenhygromyxa sp. WMMC2535]NVB39814.1 caspase family protein [Pseudenhygromyxa sp. WMMC2535]